MNEEDKNYKGAEPNKNNNNNNPNDSDEESSYGQIELETYVSKVDMTEEELEHQEILMLHSLGKLVGQVPKEWAAYPKVVEYVVEDALSNNEKVQLAEMKAAQRRIEPDFSKRKHGYPVVADLSLYSENLAAFLETRASPVESAIAMAKADTDVITVWDFQGKTVDCQGLCNAITSRTGGICLYDEDAKNIFSIGRDNYYQNFWRLDLYLRSWELKELLSNCSGLDEMLEARYVRDKPPGLDGYILDCSDDESVQKDPLSTITLSSSDEDLEVPPVIKTKKKKQSRADKKDESSLELNQCSELVIKLYRQCDRIRLLPKDHELDHLAPSKLWSQAPTLLTLYDRHKYFLQVNSTLSGSKVRSANKEVSKRLAPYGSQFLEFRGKHAFDIALRVFLFLGFRPHPSLSQRCAFLVYLLKSSAVQLESYTNTITFIPSFV